MVCLVTTCIHSEIQKLKIKYILLFTHLPDILTVSFHILINGMLIYLYTWLEILETPQFILLFYLHVLSLTKF